MEAAVTLPGDMEAAMLVGIMAEDILAGDMEDIGMAATTQADLVSVR
jgi:hypothetical protein